MKKIIAILAVALMAVPAFAKGSFEVRDFGSFKLHVYNSGDVMTDASFIVESENGIVKMEVPLFKADSAQFEDYAAALGKKTIAVIGDYHLGNQDNMILPEGMNAFSRGPVYGGMMEGFKKSFGDSMIDLPLGSGAEILFGKKQYIDGVSYEFHHGPANDFPDADILIGGKVLLGHWAPVKAHLGSLQLSSSEAVDQLIDASQAELRTGARLFLGGHNGVGKRSDLRFKLRYLKTVKKLLAAESSAEGFASALKAAYPGLAGEDGVAALSEALYK